MMNFKKTLKHKITPYFAVFLSPFLLVFVALILDSGVIGGVLGKLYGTFLDPIICFAGAVIGLSAYFSSNFSPKIFLIACAILSVLLALFVYLNSAAYAFLGRPFTFDLITYKFLGLTPDFK